MEIMQKKNVKTLEIKKIYNFGQEWVFFCVVSVFYEPWTLIKLKNKLKCMFWEHKMIILCAQISFFWYFLQPKHFIVTNENFVGSFCTQISIVYTNKCFVCQICILCTQTSILSTFGVHNFVL